ncbi:MAG: CapA family protein [Candidatus Marinimicrobia bacterium]|nr:CapA family protein [Candidatus Neomarinimicrobiota bacterium]
MLKFSSNKHIKYSFWTCLSLFFGFAIPFAVFSLANGFFGFSETIYKAPALVYSAMHSNEKVEDISSEFSYVEKEGTTFPKINAKSFLVVDLDTGQILKNKNEEVVHPIASITKLMTALISLEAINQYQVASVSKNALNTYGDSGHLQEGESLLVKHLIYPLLLTSSNDTATVLAEHVGTNNFFQLMNDKATSIGLENTYFEDPSGISSNNVSTAKDIFRLVRYLYQSKNYILNVTKEKEYDLINNDGGVDHFWKSNNTFVDHENFIGGKNGYTDEAKQTAVALFSLPVANFGKRNIAIVVLSSDKREGDVFSIVDWVTSSVDYVQQPKQFEQEPQKVEEVVKSLNGSETSLLFVGDIMLSRGVEKSVQENFGGNFSALLKDVGFLKEADITFGNLEGPISDTGEDIGNLHSFRFDPASLDALKEVGFDVFSVANNHAGDWGRDAFKDSILKLKKEEIIPVGGGLNEKDATSLKIVEKNGLKFGFLAFSDVGPEWLRVTEEKAGILTTGDNYKNLVKEASQKTDVLVVSFHFGEEYEELSNSRQKSLAHFAIDSGASIVIGHHPHVAQEIENYKDGVIAYSLGNFIFDQNFSEETMQGLALEIVMNGDKIKEVNEKRTKINNFFQPSLVE